MFYKKQGVPEIGDILICTVQKILYHSIFVSIDEYQNLDGMIHISEIAPGRIRNLRDYVTEGKRIVCKVLSINPQGNIDMSLRRVTTNLMVNKLKDFKQEEKAESLLEQIGKENGLDLKQIYETFGNQIFETYGGWYPFFQVVVEKGKPIIEAFSVPVKLAESLFNLIKEKIKPLEVRVNGTLILKTYGPNGVEDISSILSHAQENQVVITYLGAPRYKLEVISHDYKVAEGMLKTFLDLVFSMSKKLGCDVNFLKNDRANT